MSALVTLAALALVALVFWLCQRGADGSADDSFLATMAVTALVGLPAAGVLLVALLNADAPIKP